MSVWLLAAVLLLQPAMVVASAADGWTQMFQRDGARLFERSPDGVVQYVQDGGGSYGQLNFTTVWQGADQTRSMAPSDSLLNLVFDFSGGIQATDSAVLTWWVTGGSDLGDHQPPDLSEAIGSALGVNATLTNGIDMRELYWAQSIGDAFIFTFGLIDSTWRYDVNKTANSAREYFLSPALGNSSAIPFPDRSLALDFSWEIIPELDVHAGVYQTNCGGSELCFSGLDDDHWFAPVELVYSTSPFGWGVGSYRFLVFHTQRENRKGYGASLNFEQAIGPVVPFLRLSLSDKDIAEFTEFASLGVTIMAPMGRADDTFGVAWAIGQPADDSKNAEQIIETYWRFQLNPFVSLSPHVQLVLDPANNDEAESVLVAGARLQIDF